MVLPGVLRPKNSLSRFPFFSFFIFGTHGHSCPSLRQFSECYLVMQNKAPTMKGQTVIGRRT